MAYKKEKRPTVEVARRAGAGMPGGTGSGLLGKGVGEEDSRQLLGIGCRRWSHGKSRDFTGGKPRVEGSTVGIKTKTGRVRPENSTEQCVGRRFWIFQQSDSKIFLSRPDYSPE